MILNQNLWQTPSVRSKFDRINRLSRNKFGPTIRLEIIPSLLTLLDKNQDNLDIIPSLLTLLDKKTKII